jgi:hypothetical protein
MSDQEYELTTDQAEREASGAHSYSNVLKLIVQVVERQERRAR